MEMVESALRDTVCTELRDAVTEGQDEAEELTLSEEEAAGLLLELWALLWLTEEWLEAEAEVLADTETDAEPAGL